MTLNVMPVWWGTTGAATENNFVGPLRGTGTATVEISNDYTTTGAGYWTWMAALLYPHRADSRVDTTHYSFDGTCPTSGVVAIWTP